MSRDDYPYPEDEFDDLGADRSPQGVHRAPLPRWRQLLPFLIVLVLAPTLAFVAVKALGGGDGGDGGATGGESSTAQTTGPEETTGESTEPEDSTEPTEPSTEPSTEETTEPAADLDFSIQIWVLNGSGVTGLAADAVTVLEEDGWQDANAADYSRPQPSGTTLFYDNADQAEEAQAVADLLGITNLVESADAADGDIVIVLRSDFSLP